MSVEWTKAVLQVNNCTRPTGDNSLSAARRLCRSLVAYYGLPEFAELENKFRPLGLKQETIHQVAEGNAPEIIGKSEYHSRRRSISPVSPETIDDTLVSILFNIQQDSMASKTITLSSYFLHA